MGGNAGNVAARLPENDAGDVGAMTGHTAVAAGGIGDQGGQGGEVSTLETWVGAIDGAIQDGDGDFRRTLGAVL
ncbi:protein of unknown function [Limnospira indica PCC 8005]|uniref:Uncharacterized protein n=1 Tax=Limnospira indica PCC 8005 TaxID=376219 RepID=A0A9P1P0A1_9CYAN|nr:protein of unknown function [Limnospira indica PCC 8005]